MKFIVQGMDHQHCKMPLATYWGADPQSGPYLRPELQLVFWDPGALHSIVLRCMPQSAMVHIFTIRNGPNEVEVHAAQSWRKKTRSSIKATCRPGNPPEY